MPVRATSVDPAQEDCRPGWHRQAASRPDFPADPFFRQQLRRLVRVEDLRPSSAPFFLRELERQRLVVRVEHHVEALIDDALPALVRSWNGVAVQEDAERLREARPPVLLGHLDAPWREPADIAHTRSVNRPALEPAAAAENRMALTKPEEASCRFPIVRSLGSCWNFPG